MILSRRQKKELVKSVADGLSIVKRQEPITATEWADSNFFMSSESSYNKGKWKTHPYQIAILNAICNDEIQVVNWRKSARTGYTKLLVIAIGYKIEHKNRNVAVWQPDDSARDRFSKTHIDTMIRDVSKVRDIFPFLGKKHKNNTIESKIFQNQKQLHLLGGKASKNYREISVDDAFYDELSKFDEDVEKEGSPTSLGDTRLDGAVYPKSVRGSSPGIKGDCQIDKAVEASEYVFYRYVPCIHCEEMQKLEFGGKDVDFGLKWDDSLKRQDIPKSAYYKCRHCGEAILYADYHEIMDNNGIWISDAGMTTNDGIVFHDSDGVICATPEDVSFCCWAIYSHNSPWSVIVKKWLAANGSRSKLKTFVNTTLGEAWEDDEAEKADHSLLEARKEHYKADVPSGVIALVAGIDTQDDRFEIQVDGYGVGEERWTVDYIRIYGDPSRPIIWNKLAEVLRRGYMRDDGAIMNITLACQDHGGHYSDEVNEFSRRMGIQFLIPVKGSSIRNKPVVTFPRKPNKNRVYLSEVGTDTAKSLIYQRYNIHDQGHGYIHWPVKECFDHDYFKQATAEERVPKFKLGVKYYEWDARSRRNEALDCSVYSLAAIRICQQFFMLDLTEQIEMPAKPVKKEPPKKSGFVNRSGSWMKRR